MFILSPRYLYSKSNRAIQLHRRLFLLSCKHPAYLLINMVAYVRWITYYAWKLSFKMCNRLTDEQINKYGLRRSTLLFELLKLSLCNVITPKMYFKYELYKKENKKIFFNYFYDQQLPYFHNHSNLKTKGFKASGQLVGDKYRFERELQKIGIPTVTSELINTRPYLQNPLGLLQKKSVFCKPNIGSQSIDAFLIDYDLTLDRHELIPVRERALTSLVEIEAYLKKVVSSQRTLLLQPFIKNHEEIKKLTSEKASVTVRVITERSRSQRPTLLYLQLEIPLKKKIISATCHRQYYTLLPLDLNSLDVDSLFIHKFREKRPEVETLIISTELKQLLRTGIDYCIEAHHQLLDLRSVAFDLIIGESGPLILEANYNWSIEMLYYVIDLASNEVTHPAHKWIRSVVGWL